MNAREFYEKWVTEQEKERKDFEIAYAKLLLSLPIRMSYEVWSYLHSIVDLEENMGGDLN